MSTKKVKLTTWEDIEHEIYPPGEICKSDMRAALMSASIEARQNKGISQKSLGELSGVSQTVIERRETGKTNPQIDTVLKLLAPLGKTLSVVSIEPKLNEPD